MLLLPPGALFMMFFKNGFSTGKSPMCSVASRKKRITGGVHVEVVR
jgi:hypothetical protein